MAFSISFINLILESLYDICFTCSILLQLPSQALRATIRINTPTPANIETPIVKKSKTKEMITCSGADQTSWLSCRKSLIHCASTDIRLTISPTVVVCRALLLRRRAYSSKCLRHIYNLDPQSDHNLPIILLLTLGACAVGLWYLVCLSVTMLAATYLVYTSKIVS